MIHLFSSHICRIHCHFITTDVLVSPDTGGRSCGAATGAGAAASSAARTTGRGSTPTTAEAGGAAAAAGTSAGTITAASRESGEITGRGEDGPSGRGEAAADGAGPSGMFSSKCVSSVFLIDHTAHGKSGIRTIFFS